MPISKATNESSQLYFWFFPSTNPDASEEILIWLNGGVSPLLKGTSRLFPS
jgi:carboxypeptidase D